jgi:CubicO group peptidase (beta-lactamase class C family)
MLFDLASLTKVIATTIAVMREVELNRIGLTDPMANYIPELALSADKMGITVEHVLAHMSGLPSHTNRYGAKDKGDLIQCICKQELVCPPGTRRIYTDAGYILLGEAILRSTGIDLDVYCKANFYEPLEMFSTTYNPSPTTVRKVMPTEYVESRGGLVQGNVHDENAWTIGGVAGHAGLFSTAEDLGKFCNMILAQGTALSGARILCESTIREMATIRISDSDRSSGLGWMINAPSFMGRLADDHTVGHTGFTGTSVVISAPRRLAAVLLTNRVCPTRNNLAIIEYRKAISDVLADLL